MTLNEFFEGFETSRPVFEAVRAAAEAAGASTLRATKSQIAFARRRPFAWAWVPGRYLGPGRAPLVLSVALGRRDEWPRWKRVVEPSPGRFMHHLELYQPREVDEEVRSRLREAWESAG
jgi:hypothetical protein